MTRNLLEWSDLRPTLLRAVGRSGAEYQVELDRGRWVLYTIPPHSKTCTRVSDGWLADMKALAEEGERDAVGSAPAPQSIEWTKIASGRLRGQAPCGRAYSLLKVGDVWRLESLAHSRERTGWTLDEGPLAAMKRRAAQDAADEAARARPTEVPR